mmetsp:Transcript_125462/g.267886  ORF Transcript_125462/g.267886 Transcript_125462/m.267886 type:complete len:479 (+) Transcript_125462:728-2164(+)
MGRTCWLEEVVRSPIELEAQVLEDFPEVAWLLWRQPSLPGRLPRVVVDLSTHEHHQQEHPEGVHVGCKTMDLTLGVHLRGRIPVGAAEGLGKGCIRSTGRFCLRNGILPTLVLLRQAEVCELGVAILVQHDVLELQISKHDAACVEVLQRERDLCRDPQRASQGEARKALSEQVLLEITVRAVLHYHSPLPGVLNGVHQLHHEGVLASEVQRGNLTNGLVRHAAPCIELLRQPLHGISLICGSLPHLENFPELSATDQANYLEVLHTELPLRGSTRRVCSHRGRSSRSLQGPGERSPLARGAEEQKCQAHRRRPEVLLFPDGSIPPAAQARRRAQIEQARLTWAGSSSPLTLRHRFKNGHGRRSAPPGGDKAVMHQKAKPPNESSTPVVQRPPRPVESYSIGVSQADGHFLLQQDACDAGAESQSDLHRPNAADKTSRIPGRSRMLGTIDELRQVREQKRPSEDSHRAKVTSATRLAR